VSASIVNILADSENNLPRLADLLRKHFPAIKEAYIIRQIPEQDGDYYYLLISDLKFVEGFLASSSSEDSTLEVSQCPPPVGKGRLSKELRLRIDSIKKRMQPSS
jgi:hypothetical protein